MVVSRESRSLHTLSRDLLHLERSHVTRNGDECGVGRTSDITTNYFCHQTLGSMNSLIDALSDFHHKLENLVGSRNQMCYAITTINYGLNLETCFQMKYICKHLDVDATNNQIKIILYKFSLQPNLFSICYTNMSQLRSFSSLKYCLCNSDVIMWVIHSPQLISPWTKWPPFRRRYFQMHFREWKVLHLD